VRLGVGFAVPQVDSTASRNSRDVWVPVTKGQSVLPLPIVPSIDAGGQAWVVPPGFGITGATGAAKAGVAALAVGTSAVSQTTPPRLVPNNNPATAQTRTTLRTRFLKIFISFSF